MYQTLYISHVVRPLSAAELDELYRTSLEKNRASSISGALLHWNRCFLQILEGPRDAVERTMDRIRKDNRHVDLRELLAGPAAMRRFEDTSMSLINFDDPRPEAREVLRRHPPLSTTAPYYRDPLLAFALLFDAHRGRMAVH